MNRSLTMLRRRQWLLSHSLSSSKPSSLSAGAATLSMINHRYKMMTTTRNSIMIQIGSVATNSSSSCSSKLSNSGNNEYSTTTTTTTTTQQSSSSKYSHLNIINQHKQQNSSKNSILQNNPILNSLFTVSRFKQNDTTNTNSNTSNNSNSIGNNNNNINRALSTSIDHNNNNSNNINNNNNDRDVNNVETRIPSSSVHKNVSADNGRNIIDSTLRSVLSHPICFSLLYFMHKERLGNVNDIRVLPLDIRHTQRDLINTFTHKFDVILANAWNENFKADATVLENKLTSTIVWLLKQINNLAEYELPFVATSQKEIQFDNVNGKIDIVLERTRNWSETDTDSTKIPYMVFEFGMDHDQWWSKFNQGVKYVEMIYKQSLQKDTPILMVIVTIDPKPGTSNNNNSTDNIDMTVRTKIGLFFCRPRWTAGEFKGLRISLIWNSNSDNLFEGSKQFGKVFEVATLFKSCLEDVDLSILYHDYEYFSSNCCRIGDKVYRIYDNRYRQTHRSYKAYINTELQDIVGVCQEVLKISKIPALPSMDGEKDLVIISTPYRVGTHTTTQPTAFLPIIEQLVKLHSKNFVHADIRAFNMIFGEDGKNGWLIDFDFAGPCGETKYPPNYRTDLGDGARIGVQNQIITKSHDWFALYSVIYGVHKLNMEGNDFLGNFRIRFSELEDDMSEVESSDDVMLMKVKELKELLNDFENANGCLRPSRRFKIAMDECAHLQLITRGEGIGSPNNKD